MEVTILYFLAEQEFPQKVVVPDFRSVDGLYNQEYDYPPETILSHTFYKRNPEEFYRFYHNKMLFPDAKPNAAHKAWQN